MVVKKVRMKVLKSFNRLLDGQMVGGHPKHPDEDGRLVEVSEVSAKVLEDEKLAKRWSVRDETRAELAAEAGQEPDDEHEEDEDEDPAPAGGIPDVAAASTAGSGGKQTAQQVRNQRTATGTGTGRRKPAANKAPKANEQGGAPVGGHDTNASTNHPSTAAVAGQSDVGSNAGANSAPDPDAAP